MSKEKGFDVLAAYATDQKLEKDGAKLFIAADPSGKAFFVVRPFPNEDRQRLIAKLYGENEAVFESAKSGSQAAKDTADDLDKDITATANATHILVGCGGMSEEYSPEFSKKCMLDYRIRDMVIRFAVNLANYRVKTEEIEKK